jgi:uncharacterized repeat protein (TIGR01451 family)
MSTTAFCILKKVMMNVLICITACLLLIYTTGYCNTTNLLQNPGFESGDMIGWQVEGRAVCSVAENNTHIPQAYFQPVQVIAYSGDYAAFNLTANFRHIGSILSQDIEVLPDTSYEVGFWMLHGHPSQQIRTYPNILIDGQPIGTFTVTEGRGYGTSRNDYQLIKAAFVTSHKQRVVRVSFVLNASGLVFAGMSYDDFFVRCSKPVVTISPTSGTSGTVVNIAGNNYQPYESISIQAYTTTITTSANKNGAFSTSFIMPQYPSATLTLVATGANSHRKADAIFNIIQRGDSGDAPNSSIYLMNTGYFCTPDDFTSPDFMRYQAHFPEISHQVAGVECLGYRVSLETDVYDLQYDEDGMPNIDPYNGQADKDGNDDGLIMPVNINPGATNTVAFRVSAASDALDVIRYVNVLFDWNQNGEWDTNRKSTQEWAVRNQQVDVAPGSSKVIVSDEFMAGKTTGGCWVRVTLSRCPISSDVWDGGEEFEYGETEDYFITIAAKSDVWVRMSALERARLGDMITYHLKYGNQGKALATGVKIVQDVPAGLTCLSDTYTMQDNRVIWDIGNLYPAEQGCVDVSFRIEPWAGQNTLLVATATVSCDVPDANTNNNMSICNTWLISHVGDGVISGRIFIHESHNPISSVLVKAIQYESYRIVGMALTNTDGEYIIEGLPCGTYTVSASMEGYTTGCFQAQVVIRDASKITDVNIPLLPLQGRGGIAFCSCDNGNYNIVVMQADGRYRRQLTHSNEWDTAPSISMDGRRVVFIRGREWNCGNVWVVDVDGRNEQQLTSSDRANSPSFSQNGSHIVFCNNNAVCVMNVDGSGYRELIEGDVCYPAFSPDGREIVFIMDNDVYLMDIDGNKLHQLTRSSAMEYAPWFLPDGSRIIFTRVQDSGEVGIWIMNRDGLQQREIVRDGFAGRVSPDGKEVVFTAVKQGNHDLYVMNIQQGEWQRITSYSGVDTYPSWGSGIRQLEVYVWPGDTDNNGVVNEQDIFPIAKYWGSAGVARKASMEWRAQVAVAWEDVKATYADADGNGRVDVSDVLPIGMNWGLEHEVRGNDDMYAPALDKEDVNHSQYMEAYQAMYKMLEGVEETQGIVRLKETLRGIMDGINRHNEQPEDAGVTLMQNYPNPFNPECWIPYVLGEPAHVVIRIYNISGQKIRELDEGIKDAGKYISKDKAAYWDGRNDEGDEVASGVYLYQLQVGDKVMTKRAVVCK